MVLEKSQLTKANQALKELFSTAWFLERPKSVQAKIIDFPPVWKYKLKSTEHIVTIYSYETCDHGHCDSVAVLVDPKDNPLLEGARKVHGIEFDDLSFYSLDPMYDV